MMSYDHINNGKKINRLLKNYKITLLKWRNSINVVQYNISSSIFVFLGKKREEMDEKH